MPTRTIGVVIDGATGRLGHDAASEGMLAIRGEGGLRCRMGTFLMPEPVPAPATSHKLGGAGRAQRRVALEHRSATRHSAIGVEI